MIFCALLFTFIILNVHVATIFGDLNAFLTKSDPQPTCEPFGVWKPWTKECLFFPMLQIRKSMVEACDVTYNFSMKHIVPLPKNFQPLAPCGYCSFKFRCQTRRETEGCGAVNGEKEICSENSQICSRPVSDAYGCQWNVYSAALKACMNRVDIADWRRTVYKSVLDMLPESNCIKSGDQCKCCCHPYTPNKDGTACVEQQIVPEDKCPAFSPFSQWSKCLWATSGNIIGEFAKSCGLNLLNDLPSGLITGATPSGFQFPEQCGFCSFRVRCRKRSSKSGCFGIDAEKKQCGVDDCPTCANICTLPKLNGTCAWGRMIAGKFHSRLQAFNNPSTPYFKRRGVQSLMQHIPYAHCKQFGDSCKCCCHPYVPNESGTACVVADMCKSMAVNRNVDQL